MQIVVIQTAYLGDVILTTPLLVELERLYPGSKIHFVTTVAGSNALAGFKNVVPYVYEKRKTAFVEGIRELRNRLLIANRNLPFDLVLIAHRSFRSLVLGASIPARRRLSFETFQSRLLKYFLNLETVVYPPYSDAIHYTQRPLEFVRFLSNSTQVPDRRPRLHKNLDTDGSLEKKIGHRLDLPYCVVSPFSTWGTKMWHGDRFAELASIIVKRYSMPVYFCGEPDPKCRVMAEKMFHTFKASLEDAGTENTGANLVGETSVGEMVSLIANAKLLIANDSAPVHVASSFNVPTVAIFGPTVKRFGFFPLADRQVMVERTNLDCRPCSLHGPELCPKGHFKCMNEIQVEDVFKAVQNVTRGLPCFEQH